MMLDFTTYVVDTLFWLFLVFYCYCFERSFHSASQTGVKLMVVFLPQPLLSHVTTPSLIIIVFM